MKKTAFINFILKHKSTFLLILLLSIHIGLRFYQLFPRASLGWDQIDSAWAANNIIINHHFVLNGPVAKGNSGIYMGPLYYYAISIVYFFTDMDPIASPIFQAIISIGNLLLLFWITKKLFGEKVAFIAGFINTFSLTVMNVDRIQSAYYLIVPVSYLIFYALYKVITGNEKFIILLAIALGLSFQVDFTSVFYPILILCALPFFPRTKNSLRYFFFSLPILGLFFSPFIIHALTTKHASTNSLVYLFHTSYHGLHATRMLQLIHDAFISFEGILQFRFLRDAVFFVFPIFMFIHYKKGLKRQNLLLYYLITLWILIPWVVLSTYSGELTDYYFSLPRDIGIAMLAYLVVYLYQRKSMIITLITTICLCIYAFYSMKTFFSQPYGNLLGLEQEVRNTIKQHKVIPYKDKYPQSFIYYEYMRETHAN